jgi:hypothetical protein
MKNKKPVEKKKDNRITKIRRSNHGDDRVTPRAPGGP